MRRAEDVRDELLDFVKKDLVGPSHGENEVLRDQPILRYAAGVLFPQETEKDESSGLGGVEDGGREVPQEEDESSQTIISGTEETDSEKGEQKSSTGARVIHDTEHDDTIALANSYHPSAIGMSFMVASSEQVVIIQARASVYESEKLEDLGDGKKRRGYRRKPLDIPSYLFKDFGKKTIKKNEKISDGLVLHIVCRPASGGRFLITTSLYNSTVDTEKKPKMFFQVGLEAFSENEENFLVEYQTVEESNDDPEELAFAMLYRNRRVFGIGHGAAVTWNSPDKILANKLSTETIPSVLVPPVVPLSGHFDYLKMQFLAGDCVEPESEIPRELEIFCSAYEGWIEGREAEATKLDSRFAEVSHRHMKMCRKTLNRMRAGIQYLTTSEEAFKAFMLLNKAMLMQQYHSRLKNRGLSEAWKPLPGNGEYFSNWEKKEGYWRAFQLAFVLISMTSFGDCEESVEIDGDPVSASEVVDLIWFPTGGGKTEAYLGVTAFVIFLERLSGNDVAGCRVLMRYTLRLLTSQQFQRASSLICACELIRRNYPKKGLGNKVISIGLWVGMSLTPNKELDARKKINDLARKKEGAKNAFQLLSCPWCGTELNNPQKLGYVNHRKRQIFLCPASGSAGSGACPFSARISPLPVKVVDENIYEGPPTMIIGTVDKFAILAWKEQAGRIFSVGGGPRLIIQDELHLITGPLGSMVGIYEGVIDYLCSQDGKSPKIIASTATIRRAEAQCSGLYDRKMFQFPPPGLDISDSYFAKEDDDISQGRMYIGFLPTATSSQFTAQIRSVAALHQGIFSVVGPDKFDGSEDLMDPYWTLVQYFGSLKELGIAATFNTADIPEFLPSMWNRYNLKGDKRRYMNSWEELTSRKNEDEIPKILQRMESRYRHGAKWDDQALDTVLATNMISVGVDVDRLGLMMIVAQPKGTSEYIQASSRVGRSKSAPGLIFTFYNLGRPRDRSHYEQFRSYHDSFYRYVEPTSVTPFSPPAMERALHAVIVIAGRHIAGWHKPDEFDQSDEKFGDFLKYLRKRVKSIDPDHLQEFDEYLKDRLDFWRQNLPGIWGDFGGLRDEPALMRVAGSGESEDDLYSWETPSSMRNVDVECSAQVIARYSGETEDSYE